MNKNRSRYRAFVALAIFILVFQGWKGAVRPVLEAIAAHDDQAFADAMLVNLAGFCIITALVLGVPAAMIPGAIRQRNVRRSVDAPDVLVLTARGNTGLRQLLHSRGLLDRSVKKGLPGMTFTVSATPTGLQFWVGMSNPTSIVEFNWQDVDRVGTGSVPAGPRELPAVSMQVKTNGPENLALTFALSQEGLLNLLPRGRGAVGEVARSLEDMRAFEGSTLLNSNE